MNNSTNVSAAKAAFFKTFPLDVNFSDKLEIVVKPYTEINITIEAVLMGLADGVQFVDTHNGNTKAVTNPYSVYAIFNRNGRATICPVHDYLQTCLNPLELNKDGHIELSTWSVGGVVTATTLPQLLEEGYIAGYVKVLN